MTQPPCAVVVGSLHYDIVVSAPHRPAAGETVTGSGWQPVFGGKGGNQAAALVAAGVPCRMVSAIGDDGFGPTCATACGRRVWTTAMSRPCPAFSPG